MGSEAFNAAVRELVNGDMDHPIVVYCASGEASTTVTQDCLDNGFTNVKNGGAYQDVVDAGCGCPETQHPECTCPQGSYQDGSETGTEMCQFGTDCALASNFGENGCPNGGVACVRPEMEAEMEDCTCPEENYQDGSE